MTTGMSTSSRSSRVGLCIDIPVSGRSTNLKLQPLTTSSGSPPSLASPRSEEASYISESNADNNQLSPQLPPTSESHFSLRSVTGMHGLLLAETGGGLVELDPFGGGSGFKQGTLVMPGLVTPRGGASGVNLHPLARHPDSQEKTLLGADRGGQHLSRHGTLLSQGVTPARNAAELKSLLGNSRSKVKSGAKVLPPQNAPNNRSTTRSDSLTVALEQGKSRARVEVDLLLDSEICVEGGYLTGKLHVKIRKRGPKEVPVLLAAGKVRVVGFEGIPENNDRHTFYQHAVPLYTVSAASHVLYASSPDEEGFSRAREGRHMVPFAMKLPVSDGIHVGVKGPFDNRSGVVVKYIVIASFKLKDSATSKRSIAHFYRGCELYPFLNPSIVFAPASSPLLSTAARNIFLGGPGKLKLTASLHRSIWVAGQKCCVGIAVHNESKKSVKGLALSLIRTTTLFKPHPYLDVASPRSADPDACQTATTRKLVAETMLEAGQRGLRGHVTEKGWWIGVEPGVRTNFAHFILLPPDTLSIIRSRLIEVQYAIRVSLIAGSLSTEVSVMLPIQIVNHLSIDPPPSYPTPFDHPGILAPVVPLPIPMTGSRPTMQQMPAFLRCASVHDFRNGAKSVGCGQLASMFDGSGAGLPAGSSGAATISTSGLSVRPPFIMPSLEDRTEPDSRGHGVFTRISRKNSRGEHETNQDPLGDGFDETFSEDDEQEDTIDNLQDNEGQLGNLKEANSDEEVEFVVGSARLDDGEFPPMRSSQDYLEDERGLLAVPQDRIQSTVSSRSTYSMPSAEDHEYGPAQPSRQCAPHCRPTSTPITRPRPKLRTRTPDACTHSSSPRPIPPNLSPSGSSAERLGKAKSCIDILERPMVRHSDVPFPNSKNASEAVPGRTPFSQRVDRLVAARRATVKPPISSTMSESEENGTPGLITEGAGTQSETSSSEASPPPRRVVISDIARWRLPEPPSCPAKAQPPSKFPIPRKIPTVNRPLLAESLSSHVKSRIAELEGLSGNTSRNAASISTSFG